MRALKALPVAMFLALLCLPAVVRVVGHPKIPPLEEYRVLAKRPHLGELLHHKLHFLDYTKLLDAWYSDNFATRPFWVRLHTQILYSLFQESDQVYVGKQGWLYYHTVVDIDTPMLESKTAADRKALRDHYATLSALLKAKGITLYVMPLALKPNYYPEFLPARAEHAVHTKFFDTFMDEGDADGRFNLIDTRRAMWDAKRSGVKLFHQTDFHWTDPAGGLATRQLARAIATADGKPALADTWTWDVTVMSKLSGGQARALPLFRAPSETSYGVTAKTPVTDFTYNFTPPGLEFTGVAKPGPGERLSPVFVFGDSFFDAPTRAGFYSLFQSFARARMFTNPMVPAFHNRQPGTRFMVVEGIINGLDATDAEVVRLIDALKADPQL